MGALERAERAEDMESEEIDGEVQIIEVQIIEGQIIAVQILEVQIIVQIIGQIIGVPDPLHDPREKLSLLLLVLLWKNGPKLREDLRHRKMVVASMAALALVQVMSAETVHFPRTTGSIFLALVQQSACRQINHRDYPTLSSTYLGRCQLFGIIYPIRLRCFRVRVPGLKSFSEGYLDPLQYRSQCSAGY